MSEPNDAPTTSMALTAMHDEAVAQFRRQLVIDQRAAWVAGGAILVLAAIFQTWWGIALGMVIVVMTLLRVPAFAALRHGDLIVALRWVAAGAWGVSIGVVAIAPDAFPIMVLNLIGPLITTAIYVGAQELRKMTVAAIVVSVVTALLGFRSEGTGVDEVMPEWFFQLVLIMYLAAHVVVTAALVMDANHVRLATLEQALESNVQLVAADGELRNSRARVVAAGDEERVRIERNIHDGAQQRLVSLAVQLKLASQLQHRGTPITSETLDVLHDETREAIDELRELARGIYPSILAERGLADALRSLAHNATTAVRVECDDDLELLPDVAVAIYFICAEALQNVAKHAGSTSAHITVIRSAASLDVTITDDGKGFDAAPAATSRGMLNMTDRAGALGGEIEVTSQRGVGSSVNVRIAHLGRGILSP